MYTMTDGHKNLLILLLSLETLRVSISAKSGSNLLVTSKMSDFSFFTLICMTSKFIQGFAVSDFQILKLNRSLAQILRFYHTNGEYLVISQMGKNQHNHLHWKLLILSEVTIIEQALLFRLYLKIVPQQYFGLIKKPYLPKF